MSAKLKKTLAWSDEAAADVDAIAAMLRARDAEASESAIVRRALRELRERLEGLALKARRRPA